MRTVGVWFASWPKKRQSKNPEMLTGDLSPEVNQPKSSSSKPSQGDNAHDRFLSLSDVFKPSIFFMQTLHIDCMRMKKVW